MFLDGRIFYIDFLVGGKKITFVLLFVKSFMYKSTF